MVYMPVISYRGEAALALDYFSVPQNGLLGKAYRILEEALAFPSYSCFGRSSTRGSDDRGHALPHKDKKRQKGEWHQKGDNKSKRLEKLRRQLEKRRLEKEEHES